MIKLLNTVLQNMYDYSKNNNTYEVSDMTVGVESSII